jgi:hypothetical protein
VSLETSLVVDFGTDPQDRRYAFDVSIDSRDDTEQLSVVYRPILYSALDYKKTPGIYSTDMDLMRYGYATFRLYCPSSFSPVSVRALDPITTVPVSTYFYWGNVRYYVFDNGYVGNQIEYLGRFTDTITEEISFNNSDAEDIKYWYDNPTITILNKSTFINKQGQVLADPVYRGNGTFTLTEPGYGSLLITYVASYFKYRVFYHLPDNKQYYEIMENDTNNRWLVNRKDLDARDLLVVCSYQSYQTVLSVNRKKHEWNLSNELNTSGETMGTFSGGPVRDQGDCQVRYTDPQDSSSYIDVKYYKKYDFVDSQGRTLTLLFPNCS